MVGIPIPTPAAMLQSFWWVASPSAGPSRKRPPLSGPILLPPHPLPVSLVQRREDLHNWPVGQPSQAAGNHVPQTSVSPCHHHTGQELNYTQNLIFGNLYDHIGEGLVLPKPNWGVGGLGSFQDIRFAQTHRSSNPPLPPKIIFKVFLEILPIRETALPGIMSSALCPAKTCPRSQICTR